MASFSESLCALEGQTVLNLPPTMDDSSKVSFFRRRLEPIREAQLIDNLLPLHKDERIASKCGTSSKVCCIQALVQHLEGAVMQWKRQIQDALDEQPSYMEDVSGMHTLDLEVLEKEKLGLQMYKNRN